MALMRCTTIRIVGIVAAAIISSPRIIHAQATSPTVPGYIAADNSSTGAVPAVAGRVAAMTPKRYPQLFPFDSHWNDYQNAELANLPRLHA
jgi:hypothetical protein